MKALVDTGSQVTLMSERVFRRHFKGPSVNVFRFKLTAANGNPIPTVGCFVTDIEYATNVIPDCVVVIGEDGPGQPDLLLGMNVLSQLPNFSLTPTP